MGGTCNPPPHPHPKNPPDLIVQCFSLFPNDFVIGSNSKLDSTPESKYGSHSESRQWSHWYSESESVGSLSVDDNEESARDYHVSQSTYTHGNDYGMHYSSLMHEGSGTLEDDSDASIRDYNMAEPGYGIKQEHGHDYAVSSKDKQGKGA